MFAQVLTPDVIVLRALKENITIGWNNKDSIPLTAKNGHVRLKISPETVLQKKILGKVADEIVTRFMTNALKNKIGFGGVSR